MFNDHNATQCIKKHDKKLKKRKFGVTKFGKCIVNIFENAPYLKHYLNLRNYETIQFELRNQFRLENTSL